MELTHFPSLYAGKEGFEIFLRKHIIKHSLTAEIRRELLLTKKDLQDNYINFCCVHGYPIASFVCIGRHLTFLGITVKAYVGPQKHQFPSYSDLLLSREALDLFAHGTQLDEKDTDSSDNMDHDLTDLTSSSYLDTDNDTNSECSVSDDEVNSIKEEDQFSKEEDIPGQETAYPAHDPRDNASWNTTGYTSWDTGFYTQEDKITVFEYVDFLEDFMASFF